MKPNLKALEIRLKRYIKRDLPRIVGIEAVNHFKNSFDKQGFTDKSLAKWKNAKRRDPNSKWYGFEYRSTAKLPANHPRRKGTIKKYKARKETPITNYSPAATKRKILSGSTGDLKESLEYQIQPGRVIVSSNLPYAEIQNEGGTAQIFGKKTFKMPKRQFMGKSQQLDKTIERLLDEDLKRIFNQ